MTPCPHCGSPDRDRQCRYTWWMPYADTYKRSGADRPCQWDRDAERALPVRRRKVYALRVLFAIVAVLIIWDIWR